MNTPNPLVPKGSLQEQSKKKSQVRLIVFSILAVHVIALGVLLIQGCKREDPLPVTPVTPTVPVDTISNPPPVTPPPTNPPAVIVNPPAPVSNPPAAVVNPPGGAAVPPVVEPAGATGEHIVAKNDTFAIIAKKYGVSVKAIEAANPGVDSRRLKIKQKLVIPPKPPTTGAAPTTSATTPKPEAEAAAAENLYTVKKGDNLTKIAKDHGVTVKAIRAANSLKTDQIKLGQKLKVPARSASSAHAAPAAPAASVSAPMPAAAPAVPSAPAAP